MAKVPAKPPELLAREEIAHLFACCSHPVHRMLLQTMYAAGLRVSEACALRVADIDSHSDRMCIRVACGKGGHARYTLLSPTLLTNLRTFVRTFGPRTWLFCNHTGTQPVNIQSAQRAYQGSRHRARLMKERWPAHPAPRFRHPPAGGRRGPLHHPEAAGPWPHQHHGTLPAPH